MKPYKTGCGLVNSLINKLPFEFHLPGYQFCGPGTNVDERVARGEEGIDELDGGCKVHDITYKKNKDLKARHAADKKLLELAWRIAKSSQHSLRERANAWIIVNAMKIKLKLGMGISKRKGVKKRGGELKEKKKKKKTITFGKIVQAARNAIKNNKTLPLDKMTKQAYLAAKRIVGKKRKSKFFSPRIIPLPKTGGFLPLLPIFAGLSALGTLTGGAAAIAKAVNDAKSAKEKLQESERHNKTMEAIAVGKKGDGLFLRREKNGYGLFLKRFNSKN